MKLQILGCGTSTGVPLPGCHCNVCKSTNPRNKRSRTAAVLRLDDGRNVLIDASVDLRWQALQFGVERVDAVVFTHAHADHILGVDDLRSFNFVQKEKIACFANSVAATELTRFFNYIFAPDPNYKGGDVAKLTLTEIKPFEPFEVCNVSITPLLLEHGPMPVCGFRIGDLVYATDCNRIPNESMGLMQGARTMIIDGLREQPHYSHFTLAQAVQVAQELRPEQTYIIHMGHTVDYDLVSRNLPDGIALAYDGLEIDISF